MPSTPDNSPFPATRWSLVLRARDSGDPESAREALAELCRAYWYPLYAFARRRGRSPHDAEDAAQGFFAYLLQRNLFQAAEPQIGTLRTFLLTAFHGYLNRAREREHARKRGAGSPLLSLDAASDEARYAEEPADPATPERLYERAWAFSVLRRTLHALAADEAAAGRSAEFHVLESFLSLEGAGEITFAQAAAALRVSEDAVRQAVSRLRGKFRTRLRRAIAETLRDPAESQIAEELAALRMALRS